MRSCVLVNVQALANDQMTIVGRFFFFREVARGGLAARSGFLWLS